MANQKQLEVACFDAETAIAALACKANRIELCRDRDAAGLTPSTYVVQCFPSASVANVLK